MEVKVFDVKHGACALITTDDDRRIMIDCGHNEDTEWYPGSYLCDQGVDRLDMLVVTNYDEDHLSGLPNLMDNVSIRMLLRNHSVTPDILRKLKAENGMGDGTECLLEMMGRFTQDSTPEDNIFAGLTYQPFYLNHPAAQDANNLSLALHLKIHKTGFLFPGDLEKPGWQGLLGRDANFRLAVSDVGVLHAAHHGRINGLEPDLFTKYGCNPYWIVISDKGHEHETQQTVPQYGQYAKGAKFRDEERKVLTTRADGTITFAFEDGKWWGE